MAVRHVGLEAVDVGAGRSDSIGRPLGLVGRLLVVDGDRCAFGSRQRGNLGADATAAPGH
jgi:hypothetical protein